MLLIFFLLSLINDKYEILCVFFSRNSINILNVTARTIGHKAGFVAYQSFGCCEIDECFIFIECQCQSLVSRTYGILSVDVCSFIYYAYNVFSF